MGDQVVSILIKVFQSHRQMMEWANFYNGVSRGLSTILNSGDNMDFGLSDQLGTTRELKRVKQVIASQSQCQIASELQIQPEDRNPRRLVIWLKQFHAFSDKPPRKMARALLIGNGSSRKSKKTRSFHPHWLASFWLRVCPDKVWASIPLIYTNSCHASCFQLSYSLHNKPRGLFYSRENTTLIIVLLVSDKLVVVSLLLGTSVAYRGTSNFYVSPSWWHSLLRYSDQQNDLRSPTIPTPADFMWLPNWTCDTDSCSVIAGMLVRQKHECPVNQRLNQSDVKRSVLRNRLIFRALCLCSIRWFRRWIDQSR